MATSPVQKNVWSRRLTVYPHRGLEKKSGATLGVNQSFYQGLFLAPTVVAGALKGAIFAANAYEKLGYKVIPDSTESRHDIIQAVN